MVSTWFIMFLLLAADLIPSGNHRGLRTEAVKQYQLCYKLLKSELGIEPRVRTKGLEGSDPTRSIELIEAKSVLMSRSVEEVAEFVADFEASIQRLKAHLYRS